jgi:hypothetical protein
LHNFFDIVLGIKSAIVAGLSAVGERMLKVSTSLHSRPNLASFGMHDLICIRQPSSSVRCNEED